MLRLFKQGSFLIQWLLIIIALVLPQILLAPEIQCPQSSPLSFCFWIHPESLTSRIIQVGLTLLIIAGASLLLRIARLTSFNTFLPSLFTVFLIQGLSPVGLDANESSALILLLLALMQLFLRSERSEGLQEIFIASVLLGTSALFHPVFGFSFALPIGYLLIFRSYQWRQWIVAIMGYIVPQIFTLMYFFWFDRLAELTTYYQEFLPVGGDISGLFTGWWLYVSIPLAVASIYAVGSTLLHQSDKKIHVRAQMSTFILLLILASAVPLVYSGMNMFVLILPLAWLLSIRTMESKSRRGAGLTFILLFLLYIASILNQAFGVA